MNENLKAFLKELAAITDKYGYVIDGCGCCGSPFVERMDGNTAGICLGYDEITKTYKLANPETEMYMETDTTEEQPKQGTNPLLQLNPLAQMGAVLGAALKQMDD